MGCGASRRHHSENAIAPCKDDVAKGLIPRRDSLLHGWVHTMQSDIFQGLINACDVLYKDNNCEEFPQLGAPDVDLVIQRFIPCLRSILSRPRTKFIEADTRPSSGTTGHWHSQASSEHSKKGEDREKQVEQFRISSSGDSSSNQAWGRSLSDQRETRENDACHSNSPSPLPMLAPTSSKDSSLNQGWGRSLSDQQESQVPDAGVEKPPCILPLLAPPSRSQSTGFELSRPASHSSDQAVQRKPSTDEFLRMASDTNGFSKVSSSASVTFMHIHRLASDAGDVRAITHAADFDLSRLPSAQCAPASIQGFLESKTAAALTMSMPANGFLSSTEAFPTLKEEGSDQEDDLGGETIETIPEQNFQSVKMALQSMKGGGVGDAFKSSMGLNMGRAAKLPDPKSFATATCLFFDIVEFSKICAERSSEDVGQWLLKIHEVVEVFMKQHDVQIVEIRGDCYICITGTNHVPGDRPENQMTRMLAFACGVQNTLANRLSTPVRIGVATGSCTIGYIRANNSTVNICAYGDTINMAARMEQNGKPGRVLLTATAAQILKNEACSAEDKALPVRMTNVKGKGPYPTVWYDSLTEDFLDDPEDLTAQKCPAPLGRRYTFPCGARGADVTVQELQAYMVPS